MIFLLLCSLLFLGSVAGEKKCTTPQGTPGQCVLFRSCLAFINLIKHQPLSFEVLDQLRQYSCGEGFVCCETGAGPCITTEKKLGICQVLTKCEKFMDLLQKKPILPGPIINYIKNAECDVDSDDDKARVCCPVDLDKIVSKFRGAEEEQEPKSVSTVSEKLPSPGECGIQQEGNKIIGGSVTSITEFPWMVLLEFGDYNKPTLPCGGTLISDRFVLTAAHCVTGPTTDKLGPLKRIRLGEYDLVNTTDCVEELGYLDCTDPIRRKEVADIIVHEDFSFSKKSHDIALVKLRYRAQFTDFVRPICLPTLDQTIPEAFFVAGWGQSEYYNQNPVKLKVKIPLYDHNRCKDFYKPDKEKFVIGDGQICAGSEPGKDSCTGDSGGPLMAFEGRTEEGEVWFQYGIVSFGAQPCGKTQPAVYTKVKEYLPWIYEKVSQTIRT